MPQDSRHVAVPHTADWDLRDQSSVTVNARPCLAGSPTQFAIVRRDGLAIMLRRVADASCIRPNEKQGGTWDVFFWVNGLASLFAELSARGADIVYGPTVQDAYSMEEFAVRDGDGHVLGFGEQLTPSLAK